MKSGTGGLEATDPKRQDKLVGYLPLILLAIGLTVAGVMLLNLTSTLTFNSDEWNLLLVRQGWGIGQVMEPFNGHPIMVPAVVFKGLQDLFGMDSARPMQLAATGTFLLTNAILFVYLRRRLGPWGALIGTALILFLGAAFEDLLFAFQIGYFGALAAGLAALVALDRDDRTGDIAAAILLLTSMTFSSVGIAFVAAAVVEWALNPRDRRRRLFVPGVAILFYVFWWIIWGHSANAESLDPSFHLSALPKVPGFLFDVFASGLVSLAGLATGDGFEPEQRHLIWGQLGVLVFVGLAVWRIRRLGRVPRALAVSASGTLCLFLLFALAQDAYLAYGPGQVRPATASRYQLPVAIFILIVASDLLKGIRLRPWHLALAAILSVFAISGGIQLMSDKAEQRWQPAALYTKATLSGIEAAGPDVQSGYAFSLETSFDIPIDDYTKAVEAHGSPALSETELSQLDPPFRATADAALFDAIGIVVTGTPALFPEKTCRRVPVEEPVELEPGTWSIVNRGGSDLALSLARIGDPPGLPIGAILPGATAGLDLPKGTLEAPWSLSFVGSGPVEVCG